MNDAKDLQILKALERLDTVAAHRRIEPIESPTIRRYLSDRTMNYFIITDTSDVL